MPPRRKERTAASAAAPAPAQPMQLPSDAAELLAQKIRELELSREEEQSKGKKSDKDKAQKAAKTKLKEAKSIANSSELSDAEKVDQLWSRLQGEHSRAEVVEKEALAVRSQILDAEEERRDAKTALHRTLFVKNKVEALCTNLQQQTQVLVDERKRLIEQERRRRQELADGFQNTISDVKKKMDEQALERARLARENEDLRSRFKQFFEQYDRREKELLEQQKTGAAETEAFEKKYADQHYLWRQATHREQMAQQDNEELLATEKALRDQLQTYTGKFNQFQDALSKSEKVLGQYKRQRNKIQRRVEGLVKENAELKARNDKKNQATKRELEAALKDKDEAQEKCKMLQAELLKQRTHGGG